MGQGIEGGSERAHLSKNRLRLGTQRVVEGFGLLLEALAVLRVVEAEPLEGKGGSGPGAGAFSIDEDD